MVPTPVDWIQQYVATQATRIMDTHPEQTVKATALQLVFPTTANFCRYFKRATGIYPQAYKERREDVGLFSRDDTCPHTFSPIKLQQAQKKAQSLRQLCALLFSR